MHLDLFRFFAVVCTVQCTLQTHFAQLFDLTNFGTKQTPLSNTLFRTTGAILFIELE